MEIYKKPKSDFFSKYATRVEAYNEGLRWHIKDFFAAPNLKDIMMPNNNIFGEFHKVLWPSGIRNIYLAYNDISGLTANMASYQKLKYLTIYNNNITGEIPIVSLPELINFHMGNNQLSGGLPTWVNNPALKQLHLYGNNLSGAIPTFEFLPELEIINLSWNAFDSVDENFAVSSNLKDFSAKGNNLTQNAIDKILIAFDSILSPVYLRICQINF